MRQSHTTGLSPEDRARLEAKGRILYRKSCGAGGKKTCAESFAVFHLNRGEAVVAQDLLAFVETETQALRCDDPDGRLPATEELATILRAMLQIDGHAPPGTDKDG